MRPSRKSLIADLAERGARIEKLTADCEGYKKQALANIGALRLIGRELSDLKDEVALIIVAAEHDSSQLSSPASMALALREACEARGINLRLELARLEGSQP